MDGSGKLLTGFVDALSPSIHADIVTYPPDQRLGYDALTELALRDLPRNTPFVLIGESFSGPIAIRMAATRPEGLVALVLCATFASSPQPWLRSLQPLLRMPLPIPPVALLMPAMMGRWTTPEWTKRERDALRAMPGRVARQRLSDVLGVDVTDELAKVPCPILYLQASDDRLVPTQSWRQIQRLRPDATHVVLQGPHFILQHQPKAAAQAVIRFVTSSIVDTDSGERG